MVAAPSFQPYTVAINITTIDCNVIGTGPSGTLYWAEMAKSTDPTMININLVNEGVNFFANEFFELIKLFINGCFDAEAIVGPFLTLKTSQLLSF